jgi:hypothetical protein
MGEKILNSYEIFKQCVVYQDSDFDHNAVLDVIKNSESIEDGFLIEKWNDWYVFGSKSKFADPRQEKNPVKSIADLDDIHTEAHLKVKDIIDKCIKDYVKNYLDLNHSSYPSYVDFSTMEKGDVLESLNGIQIVTCDTTGDPIFRDATNGWTQSSYDILKHNPETGREYAIGWHTDRPKGLDNSPGPKSILTVTIYLNDDYEGGEVSFLKDGGDEVVVYKPRAGDIVIFPSCEPFHHAAMPIKSDTPKYFIRHFLTWSYEGSYEWNESAKKFGIDSWIKMEHDRVTSENISGKGRKHVIFPGGRDDFDKRSMPEPFYSESQINGEDYYIKEVVYIDGNSLQK